MSFGLGSALFALGGGTERGTSEYIGKVIKACEQRGDALLMDFEDGTRILISDRGQSCCENRYMRSDDDLYSMAGQKLEGIDVKEVEGESERGDLHEIAFLDIKTDQQVVQFSFHNEHNGYYGGFGLNIEEVKAQA